MAHKLDPLKQQILDFKAGGDSVRDIARKLSEASGEHVAPSTVQHFLKQENGNGESAQIDPALILARLDEIAKHVGTLSDQFGWNYEKVSGGWAGSKRDLWAYFGRIEEALNAIGRVSILTIPAVGVAAFTAGAMLDGFWAYFAGLMVGINGMIWLEYLNRKGFPDWAWHKLKAMRWWR